MQWGKYLFNKWLKEIMVDSYLRPNMKTSEEGPHYKRGVLASKQTAVPGSRARGRVSRQCGTKKCPSASETRRLSASPAVMGNSWTIQLTWQSWSASPSLLGEAPSRFASEQLGRDSAPPKEPLSWRDRACCLHRSVPGGPFQAWPNWGMSFFICAPNSIPG